MKIYKSENVSRLPFKNNLRKTKKLTAAKPNFFHTEYVHPVVLIVEDDEDTRVMMKYLLQIWNYQVVEIFGSDEAILQAEAIHNPHLILVGGKNYYNDNLTTLGRLREQSGGKTGIIFISGFAEPAARASAIAAGADDFLLKPIDFGNLETMLKQYLRKDTFQKELFM